MEGVASGRVLWWCAGLSGLLLVWGGLGTIGLAKQDAKRVPTEFQKGEAKFTANCARCHGEQGRGTNHGPPLVHKIYEPNHHGDSSFQRAAANGVRAHHWTFGDMPKVAGVTPEDVDQITKYIRWLQREAGIM